MQINPHYPASRSRGRLLAATMLCALAVFASAAHAVGFDEKLKAPQMSSVAQVKTQAKALAATVNTLRETDPVRQVIDPSLTRQRFDVRWKVGKAIDAHQKLEDLAELGLTANIDGTYDVNLNEFPVWDTMHDDIVGILSSDQLETVMGDCVSRGFRPGDVQVVRDYIGAHDPGAAKKVAVAPIALGFARSVHKYDKLGIPVPASLVYSFTYQRALMETESNRAWLAGLLNALDAQRGRILISYFHEYDHQAKWAPENIETGIAYVLEQVRKPNFEQLVEAEVKGVAP